MKNYTAPSFEMVKFNTVDIINDSAAAQAVADVVVDAGVYTDAVALDWNTMWYKYEN